MVEEAALAGQRHRLGPRRGAEFGHDVTEVNARRLVGDEQRLPDPAVGQAAGDEDEYLVFPGGERTLDRTARDGRRPAAAARARPVPRSRRPSAPHLVVGPGRGLRGAPAQRESRSPSTSSNLPAWMAAYTCSWTRPDDLASLRTSSHCCAVSASAARSASARNRSNQLLPYGPERLGMAGRASASIASRAASSTCGPPSPPISRSACARSASAAAWRAASRSRSVPQLSNSSPARPDCRHRDRIGGPALGQSQIDLTQIELNLGVPIAGSAQPGQQGFGLGAAPSDQHGHGLRGEHPPGLGRGIDGTQAFGQHLVPISDRRERPAAHQPQVEPVGAPAQTGRSAQRHPLLRGRQCTGQITVLHQLGGLEPERPHPDETAVRSGGALERIGQPRHRMIRQKTPAHEQVQRDQHVGGDDIRAGLVRHPGGIGEHFHRGRRVVVEQPSSAGGQRPSAESARGFGRQQFQRPP